MRRDLFQPSVEGQARLLILIDAFSRPRSSLEGRTKLAKLDFFLRYPKYFRRAIAIRAPGTPVPDSGNEELNVEGRMVRYRYGPWDPAYFSLLGALIGKGLITLVPGRAGVGLRTTPLGRSLAGRLRREPVWSPIAARVDMLVAHLNLTGTTLKNFIYDNFPEVTEASWGETL